MSLVSIKTQKANSECAEIQATNVYSLQFQQQMRQYVSKSTEEELTIYGSQMVLYWLVGGCLDLQREVANKVVVTSKENGLTLSVKTN